jgi:hypothetical protein
MVIGKKVNDGAGYGFRTKSRIWVGLLVDDYQEVRK